MYSETNIFRVSDLLERLKDLQKEGYKYCGVCTVDSDPLDDLPACIYVNAISEGGRGIEEYEEINAVPRLEVIKKAWTRFDVTTYGVHLKEIKAELLAEYQEMEESA